MAHKFTKTAVPVAATLTLLLAGAGLPASATTGGDQSVQGAEQITAGTIIFGGDLTGLTEGSVTTVQASGFEPGTNIYATVLVGTTPHDGTFALADADGSAFLEFVWSPLTLDAISRGGRLAIIDLDGDPDSADWIRAVADVTLASVEPVEPIDPVDPPEPEDPGVVVPVGATVPVAHTLYGQDGKISVQYEWSSGTYDMRVPATRGQGVRISGVLFNRSDWTADPTIYGVVASTGTATLDHSTGEITYVPEPGYTGTARVEITKHGSPSSAIIDVLVGDGRSTTVGGSTSAPLQWMSDPDGAYQQAAFDLSGIVGDPTAVLLTTVDTPPSAGTAWVSQDGLRVTYTVPEGATPDSTIPLLVWTADGRGHSVTLEVTTDDQAPTWRPNVGDAIPQGLTRSGSVITGVLPEGATVELVSAVDSDGDPVTFELGLGGKYTFTPAGAVGSTVTITWRLAGTSEVYEHLITVVDRTMQWSVPTQPAFTWVDTAITLDTAKGLGYKDDDLVWELDGSLGGDALADQVSIEGGKVTYTPRKGWYGVETLRLVAAGQSTTIGGQTVQDPIAHVLVHTVGPVATDKEIVVKAGEIGGADLTDGLLWGTEADLTKVAEMWKSDQLTAFPAQIEVERELRQTVGKPFLVDLSAAGDGGVPSAGYTEVTVSDGTPPTEAVFAEIASAKATFEGDFSLADDGRSFTASATRAMRGSVPFSLTTEPGFTSQTAEVKVTVTAAAEEPPVVKPPVEEPPVVKPPAVTPPVVNTPVVNTPVVEPPAEKPPVVTIHTDPGTGDASPTAIPAMLLAGGLTAVGVAAGGVLHRRRRI